MDAPTGRPVVCRQCGKVNRTGGPDCERCGHELRSDTGGDDRPKTSSSRKRLVTRQSEDGSLVMVQLSPEEAEAADAEEIEIGRGLTGEHELEPAVADAGDGDPRRKKVLFGAVASAGILVVLLAWPFAGGDDEEGALETEAVTTPTASRGPGPRKPKLPPPPPQEKAKPKAVVEKPAPAAAAPPESPATSPDTPKEGDDATSKNAKKEVKPGAPKAAVIEPDKEGADEEEGTETQDGAEGSEGDGEGGGEETTAEGADEEKIAEGADEEKIAEGADEEGGESTDEESPSDDEEEEEDAAEE